MVVRLEAKDRVALWAEIEPCSSYRFVSPVIFSKQNSLAIKPVDMVDRILLTKGRDLSASLGSLATAASHKVAAYRHQYDEHGAIDFYSVARFLGQHLGFRVAR